MAKLPIVINGELQGYSNAQLATLVKLLAESIEDATQQDIADFLNKAGYVNVHGRPILVQYVANALIVYNGIRTKKYGIRTIPRGRNSNAKAGIPVTRSNVKSTKQKMPHKLKGLTYATDDLNKVASNED